VVHLRPKAINKHPTPAPHRAAVQQPAPPAPPAAAGKSVKVAVIADVTGPAAVYGTMQKNSYDLASDDIRSGIIDAGGAQLSFDVHDAATDGAQVVTLMQTLAGDGTTPIVLGPTLSGEAIRADPLARSGNLPVLGTSTTAEGITAIGPTIFRDALNESQAIPPTVAKVQSVWHAKTVAIIYGDDNAFTKTDGDLFARAFAENGATVVDTETFQIGNKDFGPALTRIAAKKPDVIAIGALFPEATQIVAQAGKLGLKAHMVGGNGLNSPVFYQVAGPAAQGVVVGAAWFIGGTFGGNLEFVKRFKARYGHDPDQFAAQSYAAAQVVAALVKGGATTRDEMLTGLRNIREVQTVIGPIAFDQNRDVRAAPVVVQIVNGGFADFK
jgi:branched-chain amino acid transport system substrate-binding protein